MSLVVGLVHGDQVYMGSDSAETDIHDLMPRRDPQVFCKGSFLIGYPGSFRLGNLLRYGLALPEQHPQMGLHEFMVQEFAARVRKWIQCGELKPLANAEDKRKDKDKYQKLEGLLLVGYRGHLFTIGSDGQVVEALDDYDVLGIGDEVALGALYATRNEEPSHRVCSALRAAEHLTGAVRPPFHVLCLEPDSVCRECGDCPDTRTARQS
jgi:hypothetical protein